MHTLPTISRISNVKPHVEKEKHEYLKDLWFSDVSEKSELEVHVLIGVPDYHKIVTGGSRRGESQTSPVAIETIFGWTLAGKVNNESPVNEDSESFFEDQIPLMNPNATPFEPVKTVGNDVSFDFFEIEVGSVENETTFFEGQIIPSMNPNAVPFEPPNRRPISSSFELNEIIKSEC